MRKLIASLLLLIVISFIALERFSFSKNEKVKLVASNNTFVKISEGSFTEIQKLHTKALLAKSLIKQRNFESSFCLLIDMYLAANRKRFFVYDLTKDTVINSGLVTHGNCDQYWLQGRKYGNEIGCGCTSLGKYKIGNAYQGRFGTAFKLYGLDSSNSNAFKRYIVLHSHPCVPENETEENVCQSNGCPMVSPNFLKQLEPLIKNAKKPVLLWVFDE
jgi:hypothetical protein